MSQDENMEVLSKFTEAVFAYTNDGNADGLREILADDIVVHEAPSLPYGGDHKGVDAVIELFRVVNRIWKFENKFQFTHYPAGDDAVLLLVDVDAIAAETGCKVKLRVAELYKIRDGKLYDFDVYYWDTASMLEALGHSAT